MKKTFVLLMLLIVLMSFVDLQGFRQEYNLISHIRTWGYAEESSWDYTENYYYSPTNPTLIDSIVTVESQGGTVLAIHRFTNTLENIGDNTVISYNEYNESGVLDYHYTFTINQNDDLVSWLEQSATYLYPTYVYYHYNSRNQPDSIYVAAASYPPWSYKLFYDDNGRLDYSIAYVFHNNVWDTEIRYRLLYSQNPVQYITPLDMINLKLRTLHEYEYWVYAIDSCFMPESEIHDYWVNNQWNPSELDYYVSYENEEVTFDFIGEIRRTRTYNNQGLLIRKTSHDLSMEGAYTVKNYTWLNVTPVDDQVQPLVPLLISSYPNPFSDNLNISIKDNKAMTDISIYNIKGQLVRSWKDIRDDELTWDGKDNANNSVSSGIYIIRAKQRYNISVTKVLKFL